jgi:hypothetical protein
METKASNKLLKLCKYRPVDDCLGEARVDLLEIVDVEKYNSDSVVWRCCAFSHPTIEIALRLGRTAENAELLFKLDGIYSDAARTVFVGQSDPVGVGLVESLTTRREYDRSQLHGSRAQ